MHCIDREVWYILPHICTHTPVVIHLHSYISIYALNKITLISLQACESDPTTESWRSAVEAQLIQYTSDHYPHGVCAVYAKAQGSAVTLTLCIEDHQFQPKNYW